MANINKYSGLRGVDFINRIVICVRLLDNDFVIEYNVGSQTTEQTAQGDRMANKYLQELQKLQELEDQETEISNEIVSADNLTELDDIDIQKFCNEQEAYESLDSLDSNFDYMEI